MAAPALAATRVVPLATTNLSTDGLIIKSVASPMLDHYGTAMVTSPGLFDHNHLLSNPLEGYVGHHGDEHVLSNPWKHRHDSTTN
jgi:hypothetical protein